MTKSYAVDKSIEIAKVMFASEPPNMPPGESSANMIADFIETLANRIAKINFEG